MYQLWGWFPPLPSRSKPRAKQWGCTSIELVQDLNQTFYLLLCRQMPLLLCFHFGQLQHGAFHSLSPSLYLCIWTKFQHFQLNSDQHQRLNSTIHLSKTNQHFQKSVNACKYQTYKKTSRVLGDDTKDRGDHKTAHLIFIKNTKQLTLTVSMPLRWSF